MAWIAVGVDAAQSWRGRRCEGRDRSLGTGALACAWNAPICRGILLHHLSIGVSDLERAAAFYDAVLAPLGYGRVWAHPTAVGYGIAGGGDRFAIKLRTEGAVAAGPGFHVAFAAPSTDAVDRFHRAALAHGGTDNGPAGLRPAYGANYYAAFVIDPDGLRIEAVIIASGP
jgi:catechol 2,3-dioxygenase-like lactoylglutathione lyase family enzyme